MQVTDCQPCHTAVFRKNGCIIESLTNLEAVDGLRVTVFILALKLKRSTPAGADCGHQGPEGLLSPALRIFHLTYR